MSPRADLDRCRKYSPCCQLVMGHYTDTIPAHLLVLLLLNPAVYQLNISNHTATSNQQHPKGSTTCKTPPCKFMSSGITVDEICYTMMMNPINIH